MPNQEKELTIRLKLLTDPFANNDREIVHFLISFFGKKTTKIILDHLHKIEQDNKNTDYQLENILATALLNRYPLLPTTNIEYQLSLARTQATQTITDLISLSFPEYKETLTQLNSTTHSSNQLVTLFSEIAQKPEATTRYRYELLRQLVIALIYTEVFSQPLLELKTNKILTNLDYLFEQKLYQGKKGTIKPVTIYSIHLLSDNSCIATYTNKQDIPKKYLNDQYQVKQHSKQARDIKNVGLTLVSWRSKSFFSILRKIIAKNEAGLMLINSKNNIVDSTGFMFVTESQEKQSKLIDKIKSIITTQYPQAKFVKKTKTAKNKYRGQSSALSWQRYLIYLNNDTLPIELVVMTRQEYFNYRYSFKDNLAHPLYDLGPKSLLAIISLFPQSIFAITTEEIKEAMTKTKIKVTNQLREENKLSLH